MDNWHALCVAVVSMCFAPSAIRHHSAMPADFLKHPARRCALGLVMLLAACGGGHRDGPFVFSTVLSAAEQVPVSQIAGTGNGIVTVERHTRAMIATVIANVPADALVHLHEGPPGSNGPVVFTLVPQQAGVWNAQAVVSEAQLVSLRSGNMYADVHFASPPDAGLRGQLLRRFPREEQFTQLEQLGAGAPLLQQQAAQIRDAQDAAFDHDGVGFGLTIGF